MKRFIYLVRIGYGFSSGSIFECRIAATTIEKAMERSKVVFKKEKGGYNTLSILYVERLPETVYL